MIADLPPAIIAPAPIPSRTVMLWGDEVALKIVRTDFEKKGWVWATGLLGGVTPALFLTPPDGVADTEVEQFVKDVNAGKYGELSAGFATAASANTSS